MNKHVYVNGIKKNNSSRFKKMLDIYQNCKDLDIDIPHEVEKFFKNKKDYHDCVVDIVDLNEDCFIDYDEFFEDGDDNGIIIDLKKIDKNITHLIIET